MFDVTSIQSMLQTEKQKIDFKLSNESYGGEFEHLLFNSKKTDSTVSENEGVINNNYNTINQSNINQINVNKIASITKNDSGNYNEIIEEMANKYGVPANLIYRVIEAESSFNPNAVSRAGAMGLMQLMPKTAEGLGVENAFDPRQNIEGGVKYLKNMLDRFKSVPLALAAYNAGPGAVQKHGGIPPYEETQKYVKKILGE